MSKPLSIDGREVFTSASIGIAYGAPRYTTPDEMMHDADTAMYQAKAHGKARHEVFDEDMDARTRDRLGLENDLRRAVTAGEIEVHYQPIVALPTGMCVGFESLVRWSRDGKPVAIPPKTLELLIVLVESAGRALPKDELLRTLWPDSFVEEASLTFQVSSLRRLLGSPAAQWIETVPKYGYRFRCPVQPESSATPEPGPEPNARRSRWFVVAAVGAVVVAILGVTWRLRRPGDAESAVPRL